MKALGPILVFSLLAVALDPRAGLGEVLQPGDPAPTFTAPDDSGGVWKSSDHIGQKIVVIYFYPADMTPGCTKQACSFRDDHQRLAETGVEVVGVSGDTVENHQLFKKAEKLNFTLLADPQGKIAKQFGVPFSLGEKSIQRTIDGRERTLTRGATIERYTFVIGVDGKIAAAYRVADAGGDSRTVLEAVKKLQPQTADNPS